MLIYILLSVQRFNLLFTLIYDTTFWDALLLFDFCHRLMFILWFLFSSSTKKTLVYPLFYIVKVLARLGFVLLFSHIFESFFYHIKIWGVLFIDVSLLCPSFTRNEKFNDIWIFRVLFSSINTVTTKLLLSCEEF